MAERATEQGWKEGLVMKIMSVKTQERWEENTKACLKVKVREELYVVEGGNLAGESVKQLYLKTFWVIGLNPQVVPFIISQVIAFFITTLKALLFLTCEQLPSSMCG